MMSAGIRLRGVYHWLSSTTDPAAQAVWFLACYGAGDEFVMCDAEESGVTVGKVVAWCEAVEAVTHRPCAVYTGNYVDSGRIWRDLKVRHSYFGDRPMILAAYVTETRARTLTAGFPWHGWQYTSSGTVPGIIGRVDCNQIDNYPAFDHAQGIDVPPSPPEEIPLMILVRNSEPHKFTDGETYPPGVIVWEMIAGARRHVTANEFAALSSIPTTGTYTNAQLAQIPIHTASQPLTGTITLSGGVMGRIG
jgi:hypothetical protein